MSEIEKVAQSADFIVNGYSFICEDGKLRVLNLKWSAYSQQGYYGENK